MVILTLKAMRGKADFFSKYLIVGISLISLLGRRQEPEDWTCQLEFPLSGHIADSGLVCSRSL